MEQELASPDRLYHYTNADALMKILKSGVIWASEARFLNDAREVTFGQALLARQMRLKAEQLRLAGVEGEQISPRSIAQTAAEGVARRLETLDPFADDLPRIFVACFCESSDLLSQWNLYGQDGYAVGFKSSGLRLAEFATFEVPAGQTSSYVNNTTAIELHKILYVDEVSENIIDEQMVQRILPPPNSVEYSGMPASEWRAFLELAKLKHSGFRQEQEWRLIYVARRDGLTLAYQGMPEVNIPLSPEVGYRSGRASLVPYIELQVDQGDAFAEVIVGPGLNQSMRIEALKRFCSDNQLNVSVVGSRIAFRG